MKYVVLRRDLGNGQTQELPILFPDHLTHSEVARCLTSEGSELCGAVAVSAGFVSSLDLNVRCTGESISLDLPSRGDQDSRLISSFDYFHGLTM